MTFKELRIGQVFDFYHEPNWQFAPLHTTYGPWIKTGFRTYRRADTSLTYNPILRVGTINLAVEPKETNS